MLVGGPLRGARKPFFPISSALEALRYIKGSLLSLT